MSSPTNRAQEKIEPGESRGDHAGGAGPISPRPSVIVDPLRQRRLSLRIGIVFSILLFLFSGVFVRCAWLTIAEADEGLARQGRYARTAEWVPAKRGTIRDARGFILARDRSRWVVAIDPWGASGRLAGRALLGESKEEFEANCPERVVAVWEDLLAFEGFTPLRPRSITSAALIDDQRPDVKHQYRVVGTIDSVADYERFLEYRRQVHEVRGSTFPLPREESQREFPLGGIALQLVGDLSTKGTPLFGIEERFNEELTGQRGIGVRQVDAIGRNHYAIVDEEVGVRAHAGANLDLTLDLPAQLVLETILLETLEKTRAKMVTGLVMDPETGAVIAAASVPTCERGTFQSFFGPREVPGTPEEGQDPAEVPPVITHEPDPRAFDVQLMASLFCMEPGSMIKPLVVGRGIDLGEVSLADAVPVTSLRTQVRYGRAVRTYTDSHLLEVPDRNVRGALVHSSNGGLVHIGKRLGEDVLRQLLIDFEFGESTGFDLRESLGRRPDQINHWNDHTTLSIPIGYELLVTPLQVARAYCAIANGGHLVTPHIVARIDGEVPERREPRRVLREETTADLREVLREAIVSGTGKHLDGDEIRLAGKTGTAAHYGKDGQIEGRYTSSFAGFAPAEDPRYVIVVTVERPDPSVYYASKTAAPAACEILQALLGDSERNRFQELLRDALAGSRTAPIIPREMNEEGEAWGTPKDRTRETLREE